MNLDEKKGGKIEFTDIEGFFAGCENQEAALRSVARRVKWDLGHFRAQKYISILTILDKTKYVAVSDDGGHQNGRLEVAEK